MQNKKINIESDIKKANPFLVPDNYFEELPEILDLKKNDNIKSLNKSNFSYLFKYAASVALLIASFSYFYFFNKNFEENKFQYERVKINDIYMLTDLSEVSENEIIDFLIDNEKESALTSDDIIAYLSDNFENDLEFYDLLY
ncbi:MAG: hypothetical protein PHT69_16465 [Bacteroidales bacterium]|nr:hypothetical protein [Bacteroidales bacterium]